MHISTVLSINDDISVTFFLLLYNSNSLDAVIIHVWNNPNHNETAKNFSPYMKSVNSVLLSSPAEYSMEHERSRMFETGWSEKKTCQTHVEHGIIRLGHDEQQPAGKNFNTKTDSNYHNTIFIKEKHKLKFNFL